MCFSSVRGHIKADSRETGHYSFNCSRGRIIKMDGDYLAIQLQTVGSYILVPKEWPERAHSLLLTLAEQIIAQFNYVSPVVQIHNIPTRLICHVNDCGFYYVFNKVSKVGMIGAFVYKIVVPDNDGPIQVEIISGNHVNYVPWSNKATRVILYSQKKSQQQKNICKVCGRVVDKTMNH